MQVDKDAVSVDGASRAKGASVLGLKNAKVLSGSLGGCCSR